MEEPDGMSPAVDPSPVEPMAALVELLDALVAAAAAGVLVVMRSENRLVVPRVAPRLVAVWVVVAPDVSEEEEVLLLVLVDTISVVDALIEDEPAATFETFELEFRDEIRLPLELPRSPRSRGVMIAANRSA